MSTKKRTPKLTGTELGDWWEGLTHADRIKAHAASALYEVLKDIDLRTTQARLASNIGRKKNHTEFLLGELERITGIARSALAQAEGKP